VFFASRFQSAVPQPGKLCDLHIHSFLSLPTFFSRSTGVMSKPNSMALYGIGEVQETDATTRHDDKDALNIGRLGVQQELRVCSSSKAKITTTTTDPKPEALRISIHPCFHNDHHVHQGVRQPVRSSQAATPWISSGTHARDRFFVTAYINGGGIGMLSGYVFAFFGALTMCASYVRATRRHERTQD
jgi:hypothetical protein